MRVGIDTDFLVRLAVQEHPGHGSARALRDRLLDAGDQFALTSQVVAEFVHVASDRRRFEEPMTVANALKWAGAWWAAPEVERLAPSEDAVNLFFSWTRSAGRRRRRPQGAGQVIW